jgi:hypothetical protein
MTVPVAAGHLNRRRYVADLTLEFIYPPRKIMPHASAVPLVEERRQHDQAVIACGFRTQVHSPPFLLASADVAGPVRFHTKGNNRRALRRQL